MVGKRMWGAVAMLSLALAGQGNELQGQSFATERSVDIERAELLEEYALQLANQKNDYAEAASLLREAAGLRGEDTAAVKALVQAGHLAYYAGRELVAVSTLRRAGEVALATGDSWTAAQAFRDAAWVAHAEGEHPTARELLERSQALASQVAQIDP